MSHFVSLIENALKAGDVRDPVFRESVYKGALRAFDKMSNGRPDRAEFRKIHGPQLADAITRIEQKHVSFEEEHGFEFGQTASGGFPEQQSVLRDGEPQIINEDQYSPAQYDREPSMADFSDDMFLDGEQRSSVGAPSNRLGSKLLLLAGVVLIFILLAFLTWVFL